MLLLLLLEGDAGSNGCPKSLWGCLHRAAQGVRFNALLLLLPLLLPERNATGTGAPERLWRYLQWARGLGVFPLLLVALLLLLLLLRLLVYWWRTTGWCGCW